jgi:hypothetical protein
VATDSWEGKPIMFFMRQFSRELRGIIQVLSFTLLPFILGIIFSPLAHIFVEDYHQGVPNDSWIMAILISTCIFGFLPLILLRISGKLYEQAGRKAWESDMDLLLSINGGYSRADGWLDSGYFWYVYQVPGHPQVFTRFAPYERKNLPL